MSGWCREADAKGEGGGGKNYKEEKEEGGRKGEGEQSRYSPSLYGPLFSSAAFHAGRACMRPIQASRFG